MDQQIRNRNRQHLAKALALGLTVTGANGAYRVQSETNPAFRYHVEKVNGRWLCPCRWSKRLFAAGYDAHTNAIPCKHILLAVAAELAPAKQDALIQSDPALRAAVEAGAPRRISAAELEHQAIQDLAEEAMLALYA